MQKRLIILLFALIGFQAFAQPQAGPRGERPPLPNAEHFIWYNQKYSNDIIDKIKQLIEIKIIPPGYCWHLFLPPIPFQQI